MNANNSKLRKVILLLAIVFSLSISGKQVLASPQNADNFNHCNSKRGLVYRALLKRIDFGLSDGKGNGYGLPDSIIESDPRFKAMDINRMDFGLSDGQGNGEGLTDGSMSAENFWQPMDAHRLDFGLSDGKGNGYSLPGGSTALINNVLTLICQ